MRRLLAFSVLGALALLGPLALSAHGQQRVSNPSSPATSGDVRQTFIAIPNQVPYLREGWEVPGLEMPHLADALVAAVHEDDDALKFQVGNELGAFHPAPAGGSAFFGQGRAIFGLTAPPVLPSRVLRPLGSGDTGDRFLGAPPAISDTTVIPKIGDTYDLRRHAYAFLGGVPALAPTAPEGTTQFPLKTAVEADTNGPLPDNVPTGGGGGTTPTTTPGGGTGTTTPGTTPTSAPATTTPGSPPTSGPTPSTSPPTSAPGASTTVPGTSTTTPGSTTTTPGSSTTTPGSSTTTTPPASTTTVPATTTTSSPGPPSGTTSTTTTTTTTLPSTTTTTAPTTTTTSPTTTTTTTAPTTTTTTSPTTTTTTPGGNGGNPSTSFVLGNQRASATWCLSNGTGGTDNPSCDKLFDPSSSGLIRPGVAQRVNLTLWNVTPDSNTDAVALKVFAPQACTSGTVAGPAVGSANLCDGLRLRIDRYNSVTDRNIGTNGTCVAGCSGSGVTLTNFASTYGSFANGAVISTSFPVNAKAYLVITAILPDTGATSSGRGNDNIYLGRTADLPLTWQMVSA